MRKYILQTHDECKRVLHGLKFNKAWNMYETAIINDGFIDITDDSNIVSIVSEKIVIQNLIQICNDYDCSKQNKYSL